MRATDYELKVPAGTGDIVRAHLVQTDPDELAPLNWHTVKKGETLVTIAKKLKVNRTDLAEANYLSTRAKVSTGQRLIIPRAPALLTARADTPAPETESRQVDVALASSPAPETDQPAQASLIYRVKRGDTLFSIAKLYRTTVASLKTWNRLRTNSIQVGQRLTIFTQRTATATN